MVEMTKEKDKVRNRVERLLEEDERTRNDDLWLIYKIWRQESKVFIPFEDFQTLTSAETVRRMRAFIQNEEKKFLPTDPKVRIKRRINEESWRTWLRFAKEKYGIER